MQGITHIGEDAFMGSAYQNVAFNWSEDGVLYITGTVVSDNIFDQCFESAVVGRYSLCAYNSNLFHPCTVANGLLQNLCNMLYDLFRVILLGFYQCIL